MLSELLASTVAALLLMAVPAHARGNERHRLIAADAWARFTSAEQCGEDPEGYD